MIEGRDSAYPPTDAQLASFAAAGVKVYGGYIKVGNDGILNGWTQADFARVRAHGMRPIAFVSGWDDPSTIPALAAAWGVLVAVDVETGIRPDGAWVQPWLTAARVAGLYGNWGVHFGRVAAFHILAAYPTSGDPSGATWWSATARPSGPCGWQWCGTHAEFGQSCDSAWYDDWFSGGLYGGGSGSLIGGFLSELTDSEQRRLYNLINAALPDMATQVKGVYNQFVSPTYATLDARLKAVLDAIAAQGATQATDSAALSAALTTAVTAAVAAVAPATGGLTPAQITELTQIAADAHAAAGLAPDIGAIRMRVEKDLA